MNACGYRVRWIFHLDQYPGLEDYFEENILQAEAVSTLFDACVLMKAEQPRGYSGSLWEVWSRTENHVLHIEDDWMWKKPFNLQQVLDAAIDGYSFMHRRARAGSTGPSLWKRHVIQTVLAAWLKNRPVTENWLRILCHHRMKYRNASEWAGGVVRPCIDVGRSVMKNFGFKSNAESYSLRRYKPISPEALKEKAAAVWTERALLPGRSPMVNRFGEPISMEDVYLNGCVFLTLSGPSLTTHDLSKLGQRGIVTMAVNNAGCVVRPNIWTYGDSTCKFHEGLFRDPAILKILPKPRMGDRIRACKDGVFRQTEDQVVSLPGVVCIERNCVLDPPNWLHEPSINWGNGKEGQEKNGFPRVLSTMIQAIRLCYYLGFRKVFLLGCDFKMAPGQIYAFPQHKHQGGINGNNGSYATIEWIFHQLRPYFKQAGFEVFNCNPETHMTAFPIVSYNDALKMALSKYPESLDTTNWYSDKDGGHQPDAMKED